MLKTLLSSAAVGALILASGVAQAALVSCPASHTTDPTSKVENAAGITTAVNDCQYLVPPNNSNVANIANINAAGFFGETDWETNGQTQIGPGGATGAWSIANPDFANFDYIIVFKDGQGTNLIAFEFNELFTNGVWSTPFTEPPFDFTGGSTVHNVSHFTIARSPGDGCTTDCTPVPEPATMALLGSGLLGMAGILGWRKRRYHV